MAHWKLGHGSLETGSWLNAHWKPGNGSLETGSWVIGNWVNAHRVIAHWKLGQRSLETGSRLTGNWVTAHWKLLWSTWHRTRVRVLQKPVGERLAGRVPARTLKSSRHSHGAATTCTTTSPPPVPLSALHIHEEETHQEAAVKGRPLDRT